jgi:hypothetical protein
MKASKRLGATNQESDNGHNHAERQSIIKYTWGEYYKS